MPAKIFHQSLFLYFLTIASGLIVFLVMRPYFEILILAAMFAVALQPLYRRILNLTGGFVSVAAFFTILIVLVLMLAFIFLFGREVIEEAVRVYNYINANFPSGFFSEKFAFWGRLAKLFPPDFSSNLGEFIKKLLEWLVQNFTALFSGVTRFLFGLFLFLISLFYLLKDGKEFIVKIQSFNVWPGSGAVLEQLRVSINAIIRGHLSVALLKGFFTALGFIFFGIPNALFWGGVTIIASFIPYVGAAIVFIVAVPFLWFGGQIFQAIGLAVWGAALLGLADNILGPRLIGSKTQIHPLFMLLSILGGMSYFGFAGLLLGPFLFSFFIIVLEDYFSAQKEII